MGWSSIDSLISGRSEQGLGDTARVLINFVSNRTSLGIYLGGGILDDSGPRGACTNEQQQQLPCV